MHIASTVKANKMIIKVKGDLDLVSAQQFKQVVERSIVKGRTKNIILDLEEVGFIDSSGLGVILGRYKNLRNRGGRLSIINPQPQVTRLLELSGIGKLAHIYNSEKEALQ